MKHNLPTIFSALFALLLVGAARGQRRDTFPTPAFLQEYYDSFVKVGDAFLRQAMVEADTGEGFMKAMRQFRGARVCRPDSQMVINLKMDSVNLGILDLRDKAVAAEKRAILATRAALRARDVTEATLRRTFNEKLAIENALKDPTLAWNIAHFLDPTFQTTGHILASISNDRNSMTYSATIRPSGPDSEGQAVVAHGWLPDGSLYVMRQEGTFEVFGEDGKRVRSETPFSFPARIQRVEASLDKQSILLSIQNGEGGLYYTFWLDITATPVKKTQLGSPLTKEPHRLAISNRGRYMAVVDAANDLVLYDRLGNSSSKRPCDATALAIADGGQVAFDSAEDPPVGAWEGLRVWQKEADGSWKAGPSMPFQEDRYSYLAFDMSNEDYLVGATKAFTVYVIRPSAPFARPIRGAVNGINAIISERGGSHLVVAAKDHTVRIYDRVGNKQVDDKTDFDETVVLKGHDGPVLDIALHKSLAGLFFLASSDGKQVRLWPLQNKQLGCGVSERASSVAVGPGSDVFVVGSSAKEMVAAYPADGCRQVVFKHSEGAEHIAFSKKLGPGRFATASRSGKVAVWDLSNQNGPLADASTAAVDTVTALLADSCFLFLGHASGKVSGWKFVQNGGPPAIEPLNSSLGSRTAVVALFKKDGGELMAFHKDLVLDRISFERQTLFQMGSGKKMRSDFTSCDIAAFSADGRFLAMNNASGGGADDIHDISVVDLSNGIRPPVLMRGHLNRVSGLCFTPDGRGLFSCGLDGAAIQWEVETGKAVRTVRNPDGKAMTSVAASADGRFFVTGNESRADLWRTPPVYFKEVVANLDTAEMVEEGLLLPIDEYSGKYSYKALRRAAMTYARFGEDEKADRLFSMAIDRMRGENEEADRLFSMAIDTMRGEELAMASLWKNARVDRFKKQRRPEKVALLMQRAEARAVRVGSDRPFLDVACKFADAPDLEACAEGFYDMGKWDALEAACKRANALAAAPWTAKYQVAAAIERKRPVDLGQWAHQFRGLDLEEGKNAYRLLFERDMAVAVSDRGQKLACYRARLIACNALSAACGSDENLKDQLRSDALNLSNNIGWLSILNGDPAAAEDALSAALEGLDKAPSIDPMIRPFLLSNLATAKLLSGRYDEAWQGFEASTNGREGFAHEILHGLETEMAEVDKKRGGRLIGKHRPEYLKVIGWLQKLERLEQAGGLSTAPVPPVPKAVFTARRSPVPPTADGQTYTVYAGSFSIKDGAKRRLAIVQAAGFKGAYVLYEGPLHKVVADDMLSLEEATAAERRLYAAGIESRREAN